MKITFVTLETNYQLIIRHIIKKMSWFMTQFLLKGGEFYQIIIRNKSELK